ncbi:hypothetical protein NDR87_31260 [Nocardia sp. CDC159]|uniref:Uncharacterized protein n=1 Tax=Nocardia pulmonis TaxID=2951408 RepID=A0A9X2J1C6_9NOCA|nr:MULTISPECIES: hypothetical protein [Nocardia]MCM6777970.1 hypothetical protein [Nocardia pulmonis]MCM6790859.1 hypothetical protein [Nocardia sp. CDC159]
MDVGQSTANALYQQAVDGTFKMEQGAAQKCADIFKRFAESLDPHVLSSATLQRLTGFGEFESSIELQNGFSKKGRELTAALTGMQEAALRMAAAYLRAGDLFEEAEAMNTRAINVASAGLKG